MSRRKGRYLRRQIKRIEKRNKRCQDLGSLEEIFSYDNLYKAGKKCCKNVRWKRSVQNFENHLFRRTAVIRKLILNDKWKPDKYCHFTLHERGKIRPIDAPRIQDRQAHKVLTQKILLPLYLPHMIYNNGASLPNKGLSFSRKQLTKDLHWHYRRYGLEGNIILMDFSKFFPTASHDVVFDRHKRYMCNDELRNVCDVVIQSTPEKIGLPLGVEPSQAEMIAYPSALDNYIKCQLSMKCAGHYMDDYYIIVPPEKNAKEILSLVIDKAQSIGLTVNRSKTKIQKISKRFKFCKATYNLTETGKIYVRGNRDGMKRARIKIKMFKRKIDNGEITYEDLWASVNGMLAYFKGYNDHNRVLKLRRLFYALFGFSPEHIEEFRLRDKRRKKCIL